MRWKGHTRGRLESYVAAVGNDVSTRRWGKRRLAGWVLLDAGMALLAARGLTPCRGRATPFGRYTIAWSLPGITTAGNQTPNAVGKADETSTHGQAALNEWSFVSPSALVERDVIACSAPTVGCVKAFEFHGSAEHVNIAQGISMEAQSDAGNT